MNNSRPILQLSKSLRSVLLVILLVVVLNGDRFVQNIDISDFSYRFQFIFFILYFIPCIKFNY